MVFETYTRCSLTKRKREGRLEMKCVSSSRDIEPSSPEETTGNDEDFTCKTAETLSGFTHNYSQRCQTIEKTNDISLTVNEREYTTITRRLSDKNEKRKILRTMTLVGTSIISCSMKNFHTMVVDHPFLY